MDEIKDTLDEFMFLIKQEHNFKSIEEQTLIPLHLLDDMYRVLEREHEEYVYKEEDDDFTTKLIPEKEIRFEDIVDLKTIYNKAKAFEMYKEYASELIKFKLKNTPRPIVNGVCPSCKQQIEYNQLWKYCPLCGQAIIIKGGNNYAKQ